MEEQNVRPAYLAGSWYDRSEKNLRKNIESYMDNAEVENQNVSVIGIIAPHAGHMYSGPVAGYAYRSVNGLSFDTVIVIAPNHIDPRLDFSAVMTNGGYQTPLGIVDIDVETAQQIVDHDTTGMIRESPLGHIKEYNGRYEHSIEIQLPFLQVALGNFRLVPVIMGNRDSGEQSVRALAEAIVSAVKGKKALIVASTDLSHFHDIDELHRLDTIARTSIEEFDPEGFLQHIATGETEACGALPVAAVMMACRLLGADAATVLDMANSGDISGDYTNAVGYLSAIITRNDENSTKDTDHVGVELGISEEEKEILRGVVQKTLDSVVKGETVPSFTDTNGKLGESWGAFVTLTKNNQLRGCIGNIIGTKPLIRTVAEMTRAAALEDPRFPQVTPEELSQLEYEISVLTPIRKVTDLDEIVIGRDGLIITKGWSRGLLLPQVATEYGWDRTTFLEHTCIKAGLPKNAWKDDDTTIEMFSAQVFQ